MSFKLAMPKLSPTMKEGTIVKWHKSEGDKVNEGDLIIEIATDKATVEHNAIEEGYLRKILINEGQVAAVNQDIAIFSEDQNESIDAIQVDEPKVVHHEEPEKKEEKQGEVKQQCNVAQAEKVSQEPAFVPEEPLEKITLNVPKDDIYDKILASPLARRLAKEKGLDLSSVKGSGPNGRIMSRDLDLAQADTTVKFGEHGFPDIAPGSYDEISLSPMRKVIAKRLQEAKSFIPHFYISQDIDASQIQMIKNELKEAGIAISVNDLIIRACSLALREHPKVNSGFNSVNQTIVRFKTVDISVAVSVKEGLITPIIRYADYKNIGQISAEVRYLAKRARENKLEAHEYKGGSFTISNLGMFKITEFLPIINPPQAAILSVGGINSVPVVKDGEVVPGKIMKLNLSCDHRVVDGQDGAEFINTLKKYLENPTLLLIC